MDKARILATIKTGLMVSNALSLVTIAVSAVIYMTGAPKQTAEAPHPARAEHAQAIRSEPRLPRARPHEPAITGSLPVAAQPNSPAVQLPSPELPVSPPDDLLQAYIGEHAAIKTCEDKVRNGLALPRSLNRILATTGVYRAPGNDTVVTFDFDALNGLGFPLAMQVQCVLDHSRIARLEVTPRPVAQ